MCRWMAYSGSAIPVAELLLKPKHSLIDQSLHSRMGATTTNGDGFGLGWYGVGNTPGVFHSIEPAWNDRNLADLAKHLVSPLVFAHVRASTGGAIQQTNCHPFRYENWLFMHNGLIREFATVKRDLAFAVDPSLYPMIEGSTDSELFFYLALTMGLQDDPFTAVERAVGFIEDTGHGHGVQDPIQMTVATTDGTSIWAFRYSSEGQSRSLFHSTNVSMLRDIYPDNPLLHEVSDETRLIVSEPLGDLPGAMAGGVVRGRAAGQDELRPFTPVRGSPLRARPPDPHAHVPGPASPVRAFAPHVARNARRPVHVAGNAHPGVTRLAQASLISQSTVPVGTVAPTSAVSAVITPALCALSGCSIFIASSTTIRSPAATSWPSSTATLTIVPCMGAVSGVAGWPRRRPSCWRASGPAFFVADRAPPPPSDDPLGQAHLDALAADLDDDRLARLGLGQLAPAAAGVRPGCR